MISALNHIAIIVSSEESISFYEKFGFVVTERISRSYGSVVFMECSGIVLEIFIDSNHPERLSGPEAKGLRHIAFTVRSLTDTVKALNKSGIETEPIRQDWHGRNFTFVKDPDGQPIEIKEDSIAGHEG